TMEKFTILEGVAAPMRTINVDTDRIIPAKYLKTIKRTGLGKSLFAEMRYREDGSENPDFVLNQPAYRNAKILVVGDNFGWGSWRSAERPRQFDMLGERDGQVAAGRCAEPGQVIGAVIRVVGGDEGARTETALHETEDLGIEPLGAVEQQQVDRFRQVEAQHL